MVDSASNRTIANPQSTDANQRIAESAEPAAKAFADEIARAPRGIVGEYWDFLWNNKRWWLTPIVLALLLIGVFVLLSATAAAPFIYTLF